MGCNSSKENITQAVDDVKDDVKGAVKDAARDFLKKDDTTTTTTNGDGSTALHEICSTSIFHSCAAKDAEMLFEISDEKHRTVNIDAQDELGLTPLHRALMNKSWMLVELLLKRGVDTSLALHVICQRLTTHYDDDAGKLLKKFFKICIKNNRKLQIDAQNKLGKTPLQLAVTNLMPEVVDVLLDRGADVSKFIFPTEDDFFKSFKPASDDEIGLKLILASRAIVIIESPENKGYVLELNGQQIMPDSALQVVTTTSDVGVAGGSSTKLIIGTPSDDDSARSAASSRSAADCWPGARACSRDSRPQICMSASFGERLAAEKITKIPLPFKKIILKVINEGTVHEGRKDYACNKCEKKFGIKHNLIRHQKIVHESRKDYACVKCEKKFGRKSDLLKHQKTVHEGRKDIACNKCEKKFGEKSTLTRHQRTFHEGRKDYACNKCEKKFGIKHNLIRHQKIVHESRKDYACDNCEKKFGQTSHLLTHIKTVHEGRKDYACDRCEKKFGLKQNLLDHQKTVHEDRKDYACNKCEQKFGRKQHLLQHQNKVHEGQKVYTCDQCEKKFGYKQQMLVHQKTVHEGRRDHASLDELLVIRDSELIEHSLVKDFDKFADRRIISATRSDVIVIKRRNYSLTLKHARRANLYTKKGVQEYHVHTPAEPRVRKSFLIFLIFEYAILSTSTSKSIRPRLIKYLIPRSSATAIHIQGLTESRVLHRPEYHYIHACAAAAVAHRHRLRGTGCAAYIACTLLLPPLLLLLLEQCRAPPAKPSLLPPPSSSSTFAQCAE
ncbi:unnamed protein product [Trichogramma brassicae]|uniref:C2H2-type domain-containing protein n=1 Tax=Trichogramma brassicae TaxID=86971 RepID=A0A6H5I4N7_9HYME|nr:unnamed protein product [Trichogramma brassicae]